MSSFGFKRKARVIKVEDQEDGGSAGPATAQTAISQDATASPAAQAKFTRKPFRQSGLRKSINASQDQHDTTDSSTTATATATATATGAKPAPTTTDGSDDEDGPAVIRPSVSRSGSSKLKKRGSSSRLSFGPSRGTGDGDDGDDGSASSTPKKGIAPSPLGQRALENSVARKAKTAAGGFGPRLPLRRFNDDDDEDDRPRYSKEYLDELQSSTPNRPRDLSSEAQSSNGEPDAMELDESELEGAMIVDEQGRDASALSVQGRSEQSAPAQTKILSATEVEERKQRRARKANEQDFISLDGGPDDDEAPRKKTEDSEDNNTRLVREDEDLGEGFDEFVEDGGLSLGKKAEREAKARRRAEMAEQIRAAEGDSDEESDDSEAERRAAFEAAQTRSGMDGLEKESGDAEQKRAADAALQVPHKITPLPDLQGCLERLRVTIRSMEAELNGKSDRVGELKGEREAIEKREAEVQGLLDETGKKYTAAMGNGGSEGVITPTAAIEAGQSPAQQIQNAGMSELAVERGLESFGTTPARKQDDQDQMEE